MSAPRVRECPELGTLRVTGPDRVSWLNGVVTCDVTRVAPGRGTWGLALDRKGKIQSVVWIVEAGAALLLGVSPGTTSEVYAHLERLLVMEDAEIEDVSPEYQWSLVVGGADDDVVGDAALRLGEGVVAASLDLLPVPVSAVVYPSHSEPAGLATSQRISDPEWTALRLAHGLPEFGVDFGPAERPHEAGLDRRAVAWTKGCYLGQEVVCMQDLRGKVSRRLFRFRVEAGADADLSAGARVEGSEPSTAIGDVRSAAFDRERGVWLVMAMLPVAKAGDVRFVQRADRAEGARYPAELFA